MSLGTGVKFEYSLLKLKDQTVTYGSCSAIRFMWILMTFLIKCWYHILVYISYLPNIHLFKVIKETLGKDVMYIQS